MADLTVQIRQKGILTLPVEFRRKYDLSEGDLYTIVDLGDGAFVLVPMTSQVARPGDKVAQAMQREGVTLDEMLKALDDEREDYYRDNYVEG